MLVQGVSVCVSCVFIRRMETVNFELFETDWSGSPGRRHGREQETKPKEAEPQAQRQEPTPQEWRTCTSATLANKPSHPWSLQPRRCQVASQPSKLPACHSVGQPACQPGRQPTARPPTWRPAARTAGRQASQPASRPAGGRQATWQPASQPARPPQGAATTPTQSGWLPLCLAGRLAGRPAGQTELAWSRAGPA